MGGNSLPLEDNFENIGQQSGEIVNETEKLHSSSFPEGYTAQRITFKSLMASVLSVLNFEKGILFTIRELILRPKSAIEEYLKHDRRKLVNPVRFLFFSTAIATLLTLNVFSGQYFSNSFEKGVNSTKRVEVPVNGIADLNVEAVVPDSLASAEKEMKLRKAREAMEEFGEVFAKSNDKFTFILLFFFAYTSFLLFRKQGYNFSEHLVINTFGVCIGNVFIIVGLLPAKLFSSNLPLAVVTIVSTLYTLYYWMKVYDRTSVKGFFLALASYVLGYIAFMIIFSIAIFAFLYFKGVI